MKISELVAVLQAFQEFQGDKEVLYYDCECGECPIQSVTMEEEKGLHVLIE